MDNQQETLVRDWSNLPVEILTLFLQFLNNTPTDHRRLCGVCTSWRSSLSQFPGLESVRIPDPMTKILYTELDDERLERWKDVGFLSQSVLNLISSLKESSSSSNNNNNNNNPDFTELDEEEVKLYLISQSVLYLISSPKESSSSNNNPSVWLTQVEETKRSSNSPNVWKLLNPLSRARDYEPLPELKAKVNFLDYNIVEVARSYSLFDIRVSQNGLKMSVLLLPGSGSTDPEKHFSVLALEGQGNLVSLKSGSKSWARVANGSHYSFVDIISCHGKFYAVGEKGKLISIDPITFEVKEIITLDLEELIGEKEGRHLSIYLVESCRRLYLVSKAVTREFFYNDQWEEYEASPVNGNPLELKVFTLGGRHEMNNFWEPVTSLGDRVFFVSEYATFSASAQEFGWCRGNCIFFTQEGFLGPKHYMFEDEDYYGSSLQYFSRFCGVTTLEDGKIITGDYLPSEYANTFWPVPTWLPYTHLKYNTYKPYSNDPFINIEW